jgi:hypothetical protein
VLSGLFANPSPGSILKCAYMPLYIAVDEDALILAAIDAMSNEKLYSVSLHNENVRLEAKLQRKVKIKKSATYSMGS